MKKLFIISLLLIQASLFSQTLVGGTFTPIETGYPESNGGIVTFPVNYQDTMTTVYFYWGPMKYVYPWSMSARFTKSTPDDSTETGIYVSNNLKTWQRYAGIHDTVTKTTSDTTFCEDIFGTAYLYIALKKYNQAHDTAFLKELQFIFKKGK